MHPLLPTVLPVPDAASTNKDTPLSPIQYTASRRKDPPELAPMEAHADPIVDGITIFDYQLDVWRLPTKNTWPGLGCLLKLVKDNGQSRCHWLSPCRRYEFDKWKDAK